jgi:D-serine deaminase-like pyridoxal phosphate-dependent protein
MTQVKLYGKYFFDNKKPLKILIEIDSGLQRCGVLVGERLVQLAKKIIDTRGLHLKGIFTHAGQVYSSKNKKEVRAIGQIEGQVMNRACNLLKEQGIDIETVSVGSTPTVPFSAKNKYVTEIRPGNYVFYDNIQISLASCKLKQCSLYILATIISQPAADRIVIDAGSKAINLDRGAHAVQLISGYGRLLNLSGEIIRLSEEHGIIKLSKPSSKMLGEPVLILPNHACAVANLYAYYHLVKAPAQIRKIKLDARGKSQ